MKRIPTVRKIVPIVEGPGDFAAVPGLLTRILARQGTRDFIAASPKMSQGRGNLTRAGGIERFTRYAALEPNCAGVLVLLDADEDCHVALARDLAVRVAATRPRVSVAVVAAVVEYENWLVASSDSICRILAQRGAPIRSAVAVPSNPEGIRNPKVWLSQLMKKPRIYKETIDQQPMTQAMDIELAYGRAKSFQRLDRALGQLVRSARANQADVSPL